MEKSTHERSRGVCGCEDPPIVCAKLVIGPLFARRFSSPALPIGIPPPKAHVDPLLAEKARILSAYDSLKKIMPIGHKAAVPIFPEGGNRLETFLFWGICCWPGKPFGKPRKDCGPTA